MLTIGVEHGGELKAETDLSISWRAGETEEVEITDGVKKMKRVRDEEKCQEVIDIGCSFAGWYC